MFYDHKDYTNTLAQNSLTFIQSNSDVFSVLISCDIPDNFLLASLVFESMTEKIRNVLGDAFEASNYLKNNKLRISLRFKDYDYNLLASLIFDNEEGSRLISYNEYQRVTNPDGSSTGKSDPKVAYKKIAILLNLYILNTISKMKFDMSMKLSECMLNRHKEDNYNQISISPEIHSLFESNPSLLQKRRITVSPLGEVQDKYLKCKELRFTVHL